MVERPDSLGRWLPPGRPARVGAYVIPGGLVYVGRHLRSASGDVEPALVNPDLPVAAPGARRFVPGAGPQLAYHLLAPATRGAYLDWLAGGRSADVAPGLVLLFCFGLERRALLDAGHDAAARDELPAITAEVRRLRARYGEGWPTLRVALDNLLELMELLAAPRVVPGHRAGPAAAAGPGDRPTSIAVRVALARFAAASAPVPVDVAQVWRRYLPALAPRSAEGECPAEFDQLFARRYRDRHGAGLVPPGDVPGIRLRYQPANPGLATTLVCREDLPDVLAEPRCARALGGLVDDVAAALDPYRRWLARFPDVRGSLAAAALLPRDLVDAGHGQLGALRVWAERQLDGRPRAVIDAAGFWAFWSTAAPQRMARDEAAALLDVLAVLDFGVEPDVRFGAPALARGPAVLFRLGRPASDRPSARFRAAAAIARCAAAVATAARPVDPRDPLGAAVLATAGDLAAALRLDPGEDLRLAARLGWLLTTWVDTGRDAKAGGAVIDRLGRQTTMVTAAEREIAGHYLVTVALVADPAVGPATVATLTRVYRILCLEPDLVFGRLHERSVGGPPALPGPLPDTSGSPGPGTGHGPPRQGTDQDDEPVVVRAAGAAPSGYALPWGAGGSSAGDLALSVGVELDRTTINRKIAESGAAATLLNAIFADADEPADTSAATEPAAGDGDPVARLDPAHRALLRELANRPTWARADFASLAAAHGVLPDGAIDVLNEVAVDAAGAPVIGYGDDRLAVDDEVLSCLVTPQPPPTDPGAAA